MCLDDFTHTRRDFLKLGALLTAAGALPLLDSLQARAASEPDAPVRIGYLPITDATPLLVAHNNGLFEAEGIQAERPVLLRSWAQVIEAFISGQVNVIHLLSPMTIWARYGSKVPAKIVAWNHVGGSGLTVAPQISEVRQLGGQSVAIPFWYSIHNVVVQQLLRDNGLTPVSKPANAALASNEVNLLVLPPSDMPPALASKRIAGFIVAEPFNALAEDLQVGRIQRFTGDVWRNHACCTVFMHEHDLNNRPAWSQKVVNAIVKAQVWTRDNRAEAAKLLSRDGDNRYTPHAQSVLDRVLAPAVSERQGYLASGAIRHAQWDEHRIDFQPYPFPSYTEELVRRLKDTLIEGDKGFLAALDPHQVASDLVDDRFVRNSIAAVGGLKTFGLAESFQRTEEYGA
ncbi:ABC transporter substrate-binding protein [Pseudomonas sp. Pseu.R1]|uniref:ABC transporter substrate-binding protein n=1 Tax=Pseudomonas sp. Pseu.R1 TaxID=3379818 RepID=UPI003B93BAF5